MNDPRIDHDPGLRGALRAQALHAARTAKTPPQRARLYSHEIPTFVPVTMLMMTIIFSNMANKLSIHGEKKGHHMASFFSMAEKI